MLEFSKLRGVYKALVELAFYYDEIGRVTLSKLFSAQARIIDGKLNRYRKIKTYEKPSKFNERRKYTARAEKTQQRA